VSEQTPGAPAGDPATDRDLALRLKARDGSALAELYDRFGRIVYALVLRITRTPADAEEVTQEVFLYAWEKASLFDGERGSLMTWLGTLARSRAIDRVRREKSQDRRKDLVSRDAGALPPVPSPERTVMTSETGTLIRAALERLPAEQRQAIEIAYFEGLSQSEIAARLNTPLGTVKTRIRQAMIRLRSEIGPLLSVESE
jgi:RNA polymerase sigma-70 factor, ECF subfamily